MLCLSLAMSMHIGSSCCILVIIMIIKYQIVAANVFPDQNYEIEINLYILHEHIQGVSHPFCILNENEKC
jgi:hypothetical protein